LEADVLSLEGKEEKKIELPSIFSTPQREDLIERVFWILWSHRLQPKGRDQTAGKKTTAETYNPPTGRGISRVPRVKGERYSRAGQAGGISGVVKGRLAHPPKSEKVIYLKANKKERKLARNSAIAFTCSKEAVLTRGHKVDGVKLPLVVSDEVEKIKKTSELLALMEKIGLSKEVERLYDGIKHNTGKAKRRGRAYRERKGPLIVVKSDKGIGRAASGIPGVDVTDVASLSVLHLAPGGKAGRLTLWAESAIKELAKEEKKKIEA
jgi:large subunit ribosomal protein L4e